MRFHVVSLPHTQTTDAFSSCAYTQKVRKFCDMMVARGHSVILYAGEDNEATCHEHVCCISEQERQAAVGTAFYTDASHDNTLPYWKKFNATVIEAIKERWQPHDFICVSWGVCHKPIGDAFPHPKYQVVENGIGYSGTFARYKVWESYAWMHHNYGAQHIHTGAAYDTVIPNAINPDDFPFSDQKLDYYLYLGRLTELKGVQIAADVCRLEDKKLYVCGNGTPPNYGEYLGSVGPQQRGMLMSHAKALIVPTQYIEPFGGVAVEAMMCGTPVITTDWGAFTETVVHGVTGFRCHIQRDFRKALYDVERLDPATIRTHAVTKYSTAVIAIKYEAYFERLLTLYGDGWNAV